MKYLPRLDRAGIMRRCGSVLTVDMAALRQVKEKLLADQRQQQKKKVAVDCSNNEVTQSSRPNRAGNRLERRQRERCKRESLRDQRTIAQTLARSLNPNEDGSDSRNLAIIGKLQSLQQIFDKSNDRAGISNPLIKSSPEFVGIIPQQPNRSDDDVEKLQSDKKMGQEKTEKEKKKMVRTVDDGLLMVVSARIYGRRIRTLIDSGATRCFISPSCVATCGLKGVPRDVFLELGNGEKILSRGYIPDIPVVTAGLTVKTGLTVTNLLHDVDLVLGMNWLQLVNPVIDWCGGKLYIPNAVHTALLQGSWLENCIKVGTVTVLSSEEELCQLKDERVKSGISVLKTPKFWKWQKNEKNDKNSRANFNKEGEWAYVHDNNCNLLKDCTMKCNKKDGLCKFFVMKTDMGIVKVKRLCNNARLPVRGSTGAAGYDLAAAQSAVVPAHGKLLVKTGLSLSMPTGCYGRIAPRSGLALKKFIDVGAGVIDEDYRGEIGVVLFNFGNDDFEVNMGDKVAQLIFEKIKTPEVVETDSLEETGRGDRGYGSTGIQSTEKEPRDQSTAQDSRSESEQSIKSKKQQISTINLDQNEKYMKQMKNEPVRMF